MSSVKGIDHLFAQRRGYDYAIIIQDHTIKLVKSIAILPVWFQEGIVKVLFLKSVLDAGKESVHGRITLSLCGD